MATSPTPQTNPLARGLRRLERAMGSDRGDRSLWVWMGPAMTVVLTFSALLFFGVANHVDLPLTLPMAVVMAMFMGALSAFYMAASSADEADAQDDDPPRGTPDPLPPRPFPTRARQVQPRPAPPRQPREAVAPRSADRERDTVGAPR